MSKVAKFLSIQLKNHPEASMWKTEKINLTDSIFPAHILKKRALLIQFLHNTLSTWGTELKISYLMYNSDDVS